MRILAVLITAAYLALLAMSLLPVCMAVSDSNSVTGCRDNLEALGVRLNEYQREHHGSLPTSLKAVPDLATKLGQCPQAPHPPYQISSSDGTTAIVRCNNHFMRTEHLQPALFRVVYAYYPLSPTLPRDGEATVSCGSRPFFRAAYPVWDQNSAAKARARAMAILRPGGRRSN